jgi:hypothetical protein
MDACSFSFTRSREFESETCQQFPRLNCEITSFLSVVLLKIRGKAAEFQVPNTVEINIFASYYDFFTQ